MKDLRITAHRAGPSPAPENTLAALDAAIALGADFAEIDVQIKYFGFDARLVESVAKILNEHTQRVRVLLMSFERQAVVQVKELIPAVPAGYLPGSGEEDLRQVSADFYALGLQYLTPELLQRAAQQQRDVHVWTVNRKEDMASLMRLGVHGIITDDPAMALQVRGELS